MPSEPGTVRRFGEDGAAGIGLVRRRSDAARAVGFHQRAAIGFLIVGDADLEHGHFHAEQRAGKGQRGAPLAGAGFGREPFDALLLVVPGLRHRGVRLVRACGRDAFVFVINLGRRAERLLQTLRAHQRRRPPHAVDVADRLGDVDGALLRYLLQDQRHRKQRLEIGRPDRLLGAGMQHRRQRFWQIGRQIVPSFGNVLFVENEFDLIAHAVLPRHEYWDATVAWIERKRNPGAAFRPADRSRISWSLSSGRPLRAGPVGSIRATITASWSPGSRARPARRGCKYLRGIARRRRRPTSR